ncbi:hypothetical protein NMY22_g12263 [Coprinellus aureogranulatus]|nr:hypothetical protein NMY22_g12263 [Coprinellus aureogranulatus]
MPGGRGRGRPKRKANDPPRLGQPNTRLQASTTTASKNNNGDLIYCPCCDFFVCRTTIWRHSKGKSIPVRAKVAQAAKGLAGASKDLWNKLVSKLGSSAPPSPSSQKSAHMAGSNQGSPMAVDVENTASLIGAILDLDDKGDRPNFTSPSSPKVSEWASNHQQTTMEEAPEDEDDSESDEDEDSSDDEGEPEMHERMREREAEREYEQNDQEDEEVNELGKLTMEQIELLRSFILGKKNINDECNSEDMCRLELERKLAAIGESLSESDLKLVRVFALKIEDNLTDATFNKFQYTFPESGTESHKAAKAQNAFLSLFKPLVFDCCPKVCIAYMGPNYSPLQSCPICGTSRYRNKQPRKRFVYIPIIQRLQALFRDPQSKAAMEYRHKFETAKCKAGIIKDVFNGLKYQALTGLFVNVDRKDYGHTFFNDPRDIALGISTDGFCPFKRQKQMCWPIILFNYNLPPDIRFNIHRIICVGVVPGPNKPHDFDSFLWPLVQELIQLTIGVKTFDGAKLELFLLRAYLILGFSDYPAVSMLHPDILENATCRNIATYDPAKLPLRTHKQFMKHAHLVQFAKDEAQAEELSKGCGLKGIPLLSCLPAPPRHVALWVVQRTDRPMSPWLRNSFHLMTSH